MKITQWQHFKNNFIWLSGLFIFGSVFMYFDIEEELKWISIFPFFIGAVLIPVLNYFSWKNKLQ